MILPSFFKYVVLVCIQGTLIVRGIMAKTDILNALSTNPFHLVTSILPWHSLPRTQLRAPPAAAFQHTTWLEAGYVHVDPLSNNDAPEISCPPQIDPVLDLDLETFYSGTWYTIKRMTTHETLKQRCHERCYTLEHRDTWWCRVYRYWQHPHRSCDQIQVGETYIGEDGSRYGSTRSSQRIIPHRTTLSSATIGPADFPSTEYQPYRILLYSELEEWALVMTGELTTATPQGCRVDHREHELSLLARARDLKQDTLEGIEEMMQNQGIDITAWSLIDQMGCTGESSVLVVPNF